MHGTQVIARMLARPGAGRLCLDRLPRSAGGGACGETALLHFLYRATPRAQFVMPAFSPPLNLAELRQVCHVSTHLTVWDSMSCRQCQSHVHRAMVRTKNGTQAFSPHALVLC